MFVDECLLIFIFENLILKEVNTMPKYRLYTGDHTCKMLIHEGTFDECIAQFREYAQHFGDSVKDEWDGWSFEVFAYRLERVYD